MMWNIYYTICFRFSLQLLCAESVFCVYYPRRKFFILRLALSLIAYAGLSFLFVYLYRTIPVRNSYTNMLMYFMCFLVTLAMVFVCFDIKLKDVLFAGSGGYALQHMAYAARTLIAYFTGTPDNEFLYNLLFSVLPFLIIDITVFFALVKPAQHKGELKDKDYRMILLSFLILISAIVLSVLAGERMGNPTNRFTTNVVCRAYSVLCCLTVLIMQFGLFKQNKLKNDNELMERMLVLEREQHKISKENIDIINIKCHDLKHQISALKNMDANEQQKSIEELEKSVMIYDSMAKTGNDALDLVLMEKSLLCDKYNIKFSYIIDGSKLSLLSTPDIYSLFGNALDNAIESVCKEPDEEKRIISVSVLMENSILVVHIDNYCSVPISFDNGLPVTTKENNLIHGFGTKSIEYIVKKYSGEMRMSINKDIFNLDILFSVNI